MCCQRNGKIWRSPIDVHGFLGFVYPKNPPCWSRAGVRVDSSIKAKTRKSSCVNARGIPPARGHKMLTPLPPLTDPPCWLDWPTPPWLDLTPPGSWTWSPLPPGSWTWPPHPRQLDLTPSPLPAGLTWPPPAGLTWPPPPPPCEQTNKVKL